jgi:N-acetylmuramate 1-kinase
MLTDPGTATDIRRALAHDWAEQALGRTCTISPLAGDASFRRYFRLASEGHSYVLMDAPPEHEDVQPFLSVLGWMSSAGLRTPRLLAEDRAQGFLLLQDFDDVTWAEHLKQGGDVAPLMRDALRQLNLLQAARPTGQLPVFDVARMRRECDLYLDWYLPRVAGHTPSGTERDAFHMAMLPQLEELAALPRVPVHLDYHSRNLMLPADGLPLGIIDFQDAVTGPVTYDLASLLYDCYQDYPEDMRRTLSRTFFDGLPASLSGRFSGFDDWHRLLRLTAMQRHIKAIGIFARLAFRDGKRQFLDEIPLTRRHLHDELQAMGVREARLRLLHMEPAA